MSFARGDLARRAALADNLAVPEPWSANDDPRVFSAIRDLRDEFRQLGITDADGKGRLPDFLLDYENLPPIVPTTLDRAHTRNSSATRWNQNGNLVEDSSDTLRLQRDPKTQDVLGLLYEPKRTQLLDDPTDPSGGGWAENGTLTFGSGGTAKGQSVTTVEVANKGERLRQTKAVADGTPVGYSFILKASSEVEFNLRINDGSGTTKPNLIIFDLSSGSEVSRSINANASVIEAAAEDLGNGWYRLKFVLLPDAGWNVDLQQIFFQNSADTYQWLHSQLEESREVTTPILQGSATRGADGVDYRFSFPDRTTGVAYSIEQQAGDLYNKAGAFSDESRIVFGTTFTADNDNHGVLMYKAGLADQAVDGYNINTRNSNDDTKSGEPPADETIDRFQVYQAGSYEGAAFIVRQAAIHTTPHTSTQLSNLKSNYLTQG